MGSWYNLEGEALANCITSRCGIMPSPLTGIAHSPQQRAEYEAKKAAWLECKNKCQGTPNRTGTRIPYAPKPPSSDTSGDIMDTRPVQVGASDSITDSVIPKISPNMKIGLVVGAAAVIGLWFYFRRK